MGYRSSHSMNVRGISSLTIITRKTQSSCSSAEAPTRAALIVGYWTHAAAGVVD